MDFIEEGKRDMPPCQARKAVVVVGRYQPPTKGHGRAISAARRYYRDNHLDAIVVVVIEGTNTSKDKTRNPLTATQRIRYLQASEYGKGVVYLTATNAFDAFIEVRKAGYEPFAVVGGKIVTKDGVQEDRASPYKEMLDKYFVDAQGRNYEHPAITLNRDPTHEDVTGVSGSVARAAVLANRYEDFRDMVDIRDDSIVQKMYNDIKKSIERGQS
jgi:nicotinamide mononucleotide adenylyltransferase